MSGNGRNGKGVVAGGTALMVVVGLLVAFAGSASAAPVTPAASATAAWAYGGSNSTSGTITFGNLTATWNTSVGVDVIFNATPTGPNTVELQAQRTIGVTITVGLTSPNGSIALSYHAVEVDNAYANLTNDSTVLVGASEVPALGIVNSSFHGTASLAESAVIQGSGQKIAGYLNASADARAGVSFSPALGVLPLNLTNVTSWSSSANATPSASWNVSYNYALYGINNTTASGGKTVAGAWNATGPVYLNGQVIVLGVPHFHDHLPRVGILVTLSGPAELYDGFILIPHGFDIFGAGHHAYDNESIANVSISSDELFLSHGKVAATALTASQVTVGSSGGSEPLASTATAANPGSSVVAQPMSVSAAQSQAKCLQFGCAASGPWFSGLVAAAVIGGLIAAVAGTVGVVEWRSYARRKNRSTQLVGGYGESLANGIPPSVAGAPAAPPAPIGGPEGLQGPGRQG